MKITVLGTGMVGNEITIQLIKKGHQVMMGSRTANNKKAQVWLDQMGINASIGTFKNAVGFADKIIFNCTNGEFVLTVLESIGQSTLKNKILIDVSNPLDFSQGMPPMLRICNTTSQGEQIQELYPENYPSLY